MNRNWMILSSIALFGFVFVWQGRVPERVNSRAQGGQASTKGFFANKSYGVISRVYASPKHKNVLGRATSKKAVLKKKGCGALFALDKMDSRVPVPLQPMMAWHQKQNMQEHLQAIQKMTEALASKNWKALIQAIKPIQSSPQMKRMCYHMGAGAKGFTALALEFHKRADGIASAAKKRDVTAVLQAISHTLKACTSCHATYKQEVVDAKSWQQRTGSMHNPMHHPMHHPSHK